MDIEFKLITLASYCSYKIYSEAGFLIGDIISNHRNEINEIYNDLLWLQNKLNFNNQEHLL